MLSPHSLDVGILQMKTNYISIYENALSDDECDTIINEFDKNKKHQRKGRSGNGKIQKKTCFLFFRKFPTFSKIFNFLEKFLKFSKFSKFCKILKKKQKKRKKNI